MSDDFISFELQNDLLKVYSHLTGKKPKGDFKVTQFREKLSSYSNETWDWLSREFTFCDEFLILFKEKLCWKYVLEYIEIDKEKIEMFNSPALWTGMSSFRNLDISYLELYRDKFDWSLVSRFIELPPGVIEKYRDRVDWLNITLYQKLSVQFIRSNIDMICWKALSYVVQPDYDFVDEFKEHLDWSVISEYQNLSESFMCRYIDLLDWSKVLSNQYVSESFLSDIFIPHFKESQAVLKRKKSAKKKQKAVTPDVSSEGGSNGLLTVEEAKHELLSLKQSEYYIDASDNELLSESNIKLLLIKKPKDIAELSTKLPEILLASDPDQLELFLESVFKILNKVK